MRHAWMWLALIMLTGEAVAEGVVYQPPLRGAPATRVGASSRGVADANQLVAALVPNHTGYTSTAQPTLYWYAAHVPKQPVVFTLNQERHIDPLVEKKIAIRQAGLQTIDLKALGYTLQPGQEYEWYVTLVRDPHNQAGDVMVGGTIRYAPMAPELADQIGAAPPAQRPMIFAQHGYWYTLLESLAGQGAAGMAPLLRQVDLEPVANALDTPNR